MRNFKKALSLTCALACLLCALSACGNNSKPSGSNTGSDASKSSAGAASSQQQQQPSSSYPTDTVNIICHAAAGGGTDAMCRETQALLQEQLGWNVVVDNKTGGSGAVGMQYVISQAADGYTMGSGPVELAMIKALGYADLGPDDVEFLGCAMSWPAALYVPKDSPYSTLQEFVDYAKEHPGEIRVANSGIGSIWHISACALADKTGIQLEHVPYDGASGAVTALLGNEIEACVVGTCEGYSYVDSGDLKCLAVFADEESSILPGVPTTVSLGFEDLVVKTWVGLIGPKGINDADLSALVAGLKEVWSSDEYIEFANNRGCDPTYYSPEEYKAMAETDYEYYSDLITRLGITA